MNDLNNFKKWLGSEQFTNLPKGEKKQIVGNYFDRNIADKQFHTFESGKQQSLRSDFINKGIDIKGIGVKETSLPSTIGRSFQTLPLHALRAGTGLLQKGAERWEGKREDVRGALDIMRGIELPKKEKEVKPLTADEGFGQFLLDIMGKGVEKVGAGVEAISETAPVKAYEKFRAKSRIAEAVVGGELSPETAKLIRSGDLAGAAKALETEKGFAWKTGTEKLIAKPIAEFAGKAGKKLGKKIEEIRPTTKRGSFKYYLASAIEGVGSTMGPAVIASIATKNPAVGMSIMFPQVLGETYSQERAKGTNIHEATQKATFYAATEILSEGLPLGILTKSGGKFTKSVFKGAAAEGTQEAVNEAVQMAYDEGILNEYTPHKEIGRKLLEAGIIGAIGGGGMAAAAHPFTGSEEKATEKLKTDILNSITETYESGGQTADEMLVAVKEGYKGQLFSEENLDAIAEKHTELKDSIDTIKKDVKTEAIKGELVNAISEGLETGKLAEQDFTESNAVDFIRKGIENDILTPEDVETLKDQHPQIRSGINAIVAEQTEKQLADVVGEDIIVPTEIKVEKLETEKIEVEKIAPEEIKAGEIKREVVGPGIAEEVKPEIAKEIKPTLKEKRLEKEEGKRRLEDVGLLKESDSIGKATLGEFVDAATKDTVKATELIKSSNVPAAKLIEGLKNKGMAALGRATKSERPAMRKNLTEVIKNIEGYKESKGKPIFGEALSTDKVRTELTERIGKKGISALEKTGKVKIITSEEIGDITSDPGAKKAQGFYVGDVAYLISDNIGKGKSFSVLMHEVGVHHGYKKILGSKLSQNVFDSFVNKKGENSKLGRAIDKAYKRVNKGTNPAHIHEEALAYFVENNANKNLSIVRKIIAKIRLWAVKNLGINPASFTHDDYIALASSALRGEVKEAIGAPVRVAESKEIFYSKKDKVDLNMWADDLIRGAKSKNLIDGAGKTDTASPKETEGPTTQKDYELNRKTSGNIKLKVSSNIRQFTTEIVEGVDKYLGSISTRLGQVSPKLKAKTRQLDFDINTKYNTDVKNVHALLTKAKKNMSRDDFMDWDYARKNSDVNKINELISKYKLQKEYALYRKILTDIRSEAIDVGLDIGEIEEYAPRILKDSAGFLGAIGKDKEWPLYSRLLKERAEELKVDVSEMTQDQKAEIISNTILGRVSGLGGIPASKQRKLKKIPAYLNQYYMDSDAALIHHLYSMRKCIEARKFFGKIPEKVRKIRTQLNANQTKIRTINELLKTEKVENEIKKLKKRKDKLIGKDKELTAYISKYLLQRDYTKNIESYVMELINNGEISPHQEWVVNDILQARFNEVGTRGLIQAYKNISYMDTMGSPISALTQIGDLAFSMYEGGVIRTLKNIGKSVTGKSQLTRKDVGVDRIAEEFADGGTLGKMVTSVFKMVGLEKIDAIGKETLLNNALEKYQKQAKNNPLELKKQIAPIFENETDSVIDDLVSGEISDNVKLLTYNRLLDFQPVGLSEMPQKYLDAGNGRLFYMLKTFTLKQFDVYRREIYYELKSGDHTRQKQGMKNFVRLTMFFVLANAGADELKDWILGRETDLDDRVTDNMLRLFGISKFVTWKARTEGVASALARQILPPFKFIDSLGKDIISAGDEKGLEMLGSVPVVGKLAYWHIGRGTRKKEDLWDRRLSKKKSKLKKIKEEFDKAENKDAYRRTHWKELVEYREIQTLQNKANKKRREINKLKSKPESARLKKLIQTKEKERTELIKTYIKSSKEDIAGSSLWSGVRGTSENLNTAQTEVMRLVNNESLKESTKPSRKITLYKNRKIELTDNQYEKYLSDIDTLTQTLVKNLISRKEWSKITDKKKAFIIKKIIYNSRKRARKNIKKSVIKEMLIRRK